jgi:uncharacterized membrane protein YfhO
MSCAHAVVGTLHSLFAQLIQFRISLAACENLSRLMVATMMASVQKNAFVTITSKYLQQRPVTLYNQSIVGYMLTLIFMLVLQVQNPTGAQKQQTKWKAGKVFVVYFGTVEMESVSLKKVQPWDAMQAPSAATGSLGIAVAQALDSVHAQATA